MIGFIKKMFKKQEDSFQAQAIARLRDEQIRGVRADKLDFTGYSAFRAHKINQQNIESRVWTKVQFKQMDYDDNAEYSTTSSRFTVKQAGIYSIKAAVQWASDSDNNKSRLAVYVNGQMKSQLVEYNSVQKFTMLDSHISSGSCNVKVNAGDFIEIYAFTFNPATLLTGYDISYFEITRVR